MPNQADQIIEGIQKLIDGLNQVNIDGTQKKFDALLTNLNTMMAGTGKDNDGLIQSVKQMNIIMERIAKVTDKDELNILMRELVGSMVALRQTITSMQGDTQFTVENLKQTADYLRADVSSWSRFRSLFHVGKNYKSFWESRRKQARNRAQPKSSRFNYFNRHFMPKFTKSLATSTEKEIKECNIHLRPK